MASSLNSILNIGSGALFGNQAAIQTTGNNIANVNTEGYSRQKVRFEESASLFYKPGQMGQGVRATEVYRMFDRFVEKSYLSKSSIQSRWDEQSQLLNTVESLFNEANSPGTAYSLEQFFNAWQQLTSDGASSSNREALLNNAQALAASIREADQAMAYMQTQLTPLIQADIARANQLMKEIATLNTQISTNTVPGSNNPNSLLDQRDLKVRELSKIVDIDVLDRGAGNYVVNTKSGMSLVDNGVAYSFDFLGPRSTKHLSSGSTFTGEIGFGGSDEYEYTVEVVTPGTVGTTGVPGTAEFRVSLDGGRTWLRDADGNEARFPANDNDNKVRVKDLDIYFTAAGGSSLSAGDRFNIVPKTGVYWNSPTTGLINVTPQTMGDGTENNRRLVGGTLTSYFDFRDNQLAQYRERLDAFAKTLTWEVNRIHSQGVGLEKLQNVLGDFRVGNSSVPLGSNLSGLAWADKLQAGNVGFAMYDKTTGEPILAAPGVEAVFEVNFDPATDSLDDVVNRINSDVPVSNFVTASIVDGRLQIVSKDPNQTFAFQSDTSGLLAGMGINTFFSGDSAGNMKVTEGIVGNLNMINAGRVNGGAEGNVGDTDIAAAIAKLSSKAVSIGTATQGATNQTLVGFYATIVAKVGGDTATAKYNSAFHGAIANDLQARQDEMSGVNLDEEMANLVKFQNSYKAAAKLITTADQMLQTIIGLKQ